MFEGDFKLNYHLAPPIIAKKNAKGELQKQKFGPAMLTGFRVLAKLKGLRGTALDIFGRTEERKTERALIGEYRASIDEVIAGLTPATMPPRWTSRACPSRSAAMATSRSATWPRRARAGPS